MKDARELYAQHTAETWQILEEEALRLAWSATAGRPWLVNALAYETCCEKQGVKDRTLPVTVAASVPAAHRQRR